MASTQKHDRIEPSVNDPVLEVSDTSVSFDMERGESRVLDSVDIDIQRGEIIGIVGESGSGKSMFASALLDAVVEPGVVTGNITYYPEPDQPINVLDLSEDELKQLRWEEIAMVFQGALASFNPTMRLGGHFRETLEAHDADVSEGMERAHQLLSELYLDPERIFRSYPHELSGGMKQRALIALSLVLNPEVLVMDEPTAALDLLMQRSIISMLEDLQETYDLTLVFITHDLPLVAELADRLGVLYAFEFVEVGPADDIISGSNHPYTRALINSTPNLDTPVEAMRPIEGESPDPVNVPTGCSYHTRCPLSDGQCEEINPELYNVGEEHVAACHYWDEVADEIPLSIKDYQLVEDSVDRTNVERSSTDSGSTQSDETVVSLEDVEVHFENSQGIIRDLFNEPDIVRAVDGVNLEIEENDVVALVGESGCGKTTLGKTTIGVERPTGGSVKYRGQDIWNTKDGVGEVDIPWEEIRRALQIIHQDPGSSLNPNKTIESTLDRPLKFWYPDLGTEDREARIYGMLERVGMAPPDDYAGRYPHQLSGGEKQRVALIRALLMNPELILADEAVSALDVSLRVDMMDLMLDLQDQFKTSYLFISHNLSNARYLAQKTDGRIGIMYLGEIVEIGPAEEVLKDPQHPYTQVLKWATADLDPDNEVVQQPPIRKIDIPDPEDPPSGCRFHTRCPEAREICTKENPTLHGIEEGREQEAACFRVYGDDHPYSSSDSITTDEELTSINDERKGAADD
ncbi:ABC transporter ATP-binding protein [Halomontanus rarus]|uniref:ABC transporter ATP-binding protein n=1 Tax=Halomontanus rarus TaxID=3034020 RepID=UPI0023E83978|nr:ABC transporter ATP-binding protein [Halovivax sp. TS33]